MKFKIGEIAIVTSIHTVNRRECEIIDIGGPADYIIEIPDYPSSSEDGLWSCFEFQLKKKRPPEKSSWEAFREATGWLPDDLGVPEPEVEKVS